MRRRFVLALTLMSCAACLGQTTAPAPVPTEPALQRIEMSEKTRDGERVKIFTLRNAHQISAQISSHGATLIGLQTPDRTGKVINIAFGGVTIGRVANRIAKGSFTLDGKTYQLDTNEGDNTLHSGSANFADKIWDAEPLPPAAHESAVKFTHLSKDGDGGFPGTLTATVTFTLTDNDELRLDYTATTDKATPLNLTNHAYFNLAGKGPVLDQELWIDADNYTPFDNQKIPTGEIAPVKNTPFDFTTPTKIGARNQGAYDHNLVLNSGGKSLALVARITAPATGRTMEVRTDQPGLQLYTADSPHNTVSFETQGFPDSIHHANFPSILLKPGETFKSTTIFTFSAK